MSASRRHFSKAAAAAALAGPIGVASSGGAVANRGTAGTAGPMAIAPGAAAAKRTNAPGEAPAVLTRRPALSNVVIGHGDFRYRVEADWSDLDPAKTPVKNCHEMVVDRRGRLIMITDEVRNNIIIFDRSGRLLEAWGTDYPGGHGLTLWSAGDDEFLFITDYERGVVDKTTLDGRILLTIPDPRSIGEYPAEAPYKPTETAIGPSGDIYIADGYGSQYVLQYSMDGEFIRKFGGKGDADGEFSTVHGVAVDHRSGGRGEPTLLCTSRGHNSFKRFTLDGSYLETIFLPGAYVCRAVVDGENVYAGVCWSRLRYLNQTPDSGFVTILDREDRVVSNPGGTEPLYRDGELQLMVQADPVFKHCHDVCVDDDKNLYICQWNAGGTYPIKLHRI